MSEDLNKAQQEPTVEPAAEPVSEPETQSAAPETEPAEQAKDDGKKKDGWFNKKARELDAIKAQLETAEQTAAKAKDQLLRMAAEYDNYRKRSTREATRNSTTAFPLLSIRSCPFWTRWRWRPTPPPPTRATRRA